MDDVLFVRELQGFGDLLKDSECLIYGNGREDWRLRRSRREPLGQYFGDEIGETIVGTGIRHRQDMRMLTCHQVGLLHETMVLLVGSKGIFNSLIATVRFFSWCVRRGRRSRRSRRRFCRLNGNCQSLDQYTHLCLSLHHPPYCESIQLCKLLYSIRYSKAA